MDIHEYQNNQYSKKKSPEKTYVGKQFQVRNPDGTMSELRYVTKVFDIEDFQDFYRDVKSKKICKVLRESQRQEVIALVDEDTRGFSLRLQRFNKETGMPTAQSFSFHGGALPNLIEFIDSLDLIDFKNKDRFQVTEQSLRKQRESRRTQSEIIESIEQFDVELLKRILTKFQDQDRLAYIVDSLSEIEIENLGATIKQTTYKSAVADLRELLELEDAGTVVQSAKERTNLQKYSAGKPEDVFRKWLESNLWVFGVEYLDKHPWRIISDDAIADLVMESVDGYVDLIELKRPKLSYNLLNRHSSHNGYYPSAEFSQSIGQSLLYLRRLADKKNEIERQRNTKILRPRVKLVIGRSLNFNSDQIETLRILNANLGDISVITYDELLNNAERIIRYYECQSLPGKRVAETSG